MKYNSRVDDTGAGDDPEELGGCLIDVKEMFHCIKNVSLHSGVQSWVEESHRVGGPGPGSGSVTSSLY